MRNTKSVNANAYGPGLVSAGGTCNTGMQERTDLSGYNDRPALCAVFTNTQPNFSAIRIWKYLKGDHVSSENFGINALSHVIALLGIWIHCAAF